MYFNDEILLDDKFGDESIERSSKILYAYVNEYSPSYFMFDLQNNKLDDETSLL